MSENKLYSCVLMFKSQCRYGSKCKPFFSFIIGITLDSIT